MKGVEYTAKVDALLEHVRDFTAEDFIDLALAAADQAGVGVRDQKRILDIIRSTRSEVVPVQTTRYPYRWHGDES